ncbi:hypothetical protein DE146DRAFT_580408, partial [Phaeosphaeria sp. MPI-PUGE-AT-0046c]
MTLLKIRSSGSFSTEKLRSGAMLPYAILSNAWGMKDLGVTLRDLVERKGRRKVGYDKINRGTNEAQEGGSWYCWFDTCCIN